MSDAANQTPKQEDVRVEWGGGGGEMVRGWKIGMGRGGTGEGRVFGVSGRPDASSG